MFMGVYMRVKFVLALTPLLLYLCIAVVDYASLQLYNWRRGCSVEVFDVYGYAAGVLDKCYYNRLEFRDYIHLGETEAEVIVIATHYFTSPKGRVGLGTSEKIYFYYPLLHPVKTLYVVKGILPNSIYVAAPPQIIEASNFRDKVIVLLTCKLPRLEEVVEAFTKGGARLVVVSNTPALQPSELRYLLKLVLSDIDGLENLCKTELFICYGGV